MVWTNGSFKSQPEEKWIKTDSGNRKPSFDIGLGTFKARSQQCLMRSSLSVGNRSDKPCNVWLSMKFQQIKAMRRKIGKVVKKPRFNNAKDYKFILSPVANAI